MLTEERLARAAAAHRSKAEQRRYVVTWQGGGEGKTYNGSDGFNELISLLGVTGATLNNYFSRYKNVHKAMRPNPITGEIDIAYIERIDPPAKQKNPVGRPPKPKPDWERLGSEAPHNPDGTQ